MNKTFALTLFSFFIFSACYRSGPPTPPDAPSCASACSRLLALGCPEGQPVEAPDGSMISCTEWCEYSIKELKIDLKPACVSRLENCSLLEQQCYSGEIIKK